MLDLKVHVHVYTCRLILVANVPPILSSVHCSEVFDKCVLQLAHPEAPPSIHDPVVVTETNDHTQDHNVTGSQTHTPHMYTISLFLSLSPSLPHSLTSLPPSLPPALPPSLPPSLLSLPPSLLNGILYISYSAEDYWQSQKATPQATPLNPHQISVTNTGTQFGSPHSINSSTSGGNTIASIVLCTCNTIASTELQCILVLRT